MCIRDSECLDLHQANEQTADEAGGHNGHHDLLVLQGNTVPVSYTHLDVYKRQRLPPLPPAGIRAEHSGGGLK